MRNTLRAPVTLALLVADASAVKSSFKRSAASANEFAHVLAAKGAGYELFSPSGVSTTNKCCNLKYLHPLDHPNGGEGYNQGRASCSETRNDCWNYVMDNPLVAPFVMYNYSGYMWPEDGGPVSGEAPCTGIPSPHCMRFTECPTTDMIDMTPYNGQYGPLRIDVLLGYTRNPTIRPGSQSPVTTQPSASPITPAPSPSPATTAPSLSPATTAPSQSPVTVEPTGCPVTSSSPSQCPSTESPSSVPTTQCPATIGPSTRFPTTASPSTTPTTCPITMAPSTRCPTTASPSTTPTTCPITMAPSTRCPTTASPSAAPTTGGGIIVDLVTTFGNLQLSWLNSNNLMSEFKRQYKVAAAHVARCAPSQVSIISMQAGSIVVVATANLGQEPAAAFFAEKSTGQPVLVWNTTNGFNVTLFSSPTTGAGQIRRVVDSDKNQFADIGLIIAIAVALMACATIAYCCYQRRQPGKREKDGSDAKSVPMQSMQSIVGGASSELGRHVSGMGSETQILKGRV